MKKILFFVLSVVAGVSLACNLPFWGQETPMPVYTPAPQPTPIPFGGGTLNVLPRADGKGVTILLTFSTRDPESFSQTYFSVSTKKGVIQLIPFVETPMPGYSYSDFVGAQVGVFYGDVETMCPPPNNDYSKWWTFSCPADLKPWPKK